MAMRTGASRYQPLCATVGGVLVACLIGQPMPGTTGHWRILNLPADLHTGMRRAANVLLINELRSPSFSLLLEFLRVDNKCP